MKTRKIGNGILQYPLSKIKPLKSKSWHNCSPPNWFQRLIYSIVDGCIWTCNCNNRFKYMDAKCNFHLNKRTCYETHFMWMQVNQEDIQIELASHYISYRPEPG